MEEFTRIVKPKSKIRLDKYLYKAGLGLSRSAIQKLIEEGKILVDGEPKKSHRILRAGEKVTVIYERPKKFHVEPEPLTLDIVYEDDDLIVVNKPPGMVTHPAPGNLHGTLVNALLYHTKLASQDDATRPGVVHRLDKDTSGLLVFAKREKPHVKLAKQVEMRKIKRVYLAFVFGYFELDEGTIDAPIGRHTLERKKMAVTPLLSRSAITHFQVIKRFEHITYLRLRLETGRTHQIRVHLAHVGHPVAGDATYGGRKKPSKMDGEKFKEIIRIMKRQALHAASLGFEHPTLKKYIEFTIPLPQDMQELFDFLSK